MPKRGRPTTEDRERLAASLIRARQIKAEQCDPFLAYPGVQALLKHLETHVCGTTLVVQVLSEGALDDVYRDAKAVRSLEYRQIATFLRLFYQPAEKRLGSSAGDGPFAHVCGAECAAAGAPVSCQALPLSRGADRPHARISRYSGVVAAAGSELAH